MIPFFSKLLARRQWFLLCGSTGEGVPESLAGFKPLYPPRPGCSWADPFPVWHEGRQYVFFEEVPAQSSPRKGRISLMELDENGVPAIIRPVIEQPWHLSYPFIFQEGEDWFLVPESRQNRTVDLYRCTRWPDEWRLERTLLRNVELVDPTLHYDGGYWWLFAAAPDVPGESPRRKLHLYYARHLHSVTWTPHPLNPVVDAVESARPAGRLFTDGEGRLLRPAQDCSVRYGYGITFNHVTRLDPEGYAEEPLHRVAPQKDQLATHIFNRAGDTVWADAARRI